ncbi:SIR2 family protein [Microbacterium sp.]|uniref:SIR2 family protein n=1 Tax=Microbacterium sp. TaxID=51671 RepID=UPI0035679C03
MTDRLLHDSLLTTAFSLKSNPGAYALLIGAGVSAPSGIPTAWGVLTELVERLALVSGEPDVSGDAAHTWYRTRFSRDATYENVLEQIAPTSHERQRILRDFFERSPDDIDAERKLPALAHRSIARLARAGVVKVVVTLNFDRLIEQALRGEGIEPTIISSPADVAGMAPLHTLDFCVIHLHGDYLNPTSMLNTADELHGYAPAVSELLRRVLEDYGLIVAGWSSTYDPALRRAIAEHYPARYTLTWVEPGAVSEQARDLRALKKGVLVPLDADTSFGILADAVDALATREARHPLTVAVAVETAKRELSGRATAISVHDTLHAALAELDTRPELHLADRHDTSHFPELLDRIEEASRLPAALIATLVYWGNESTDRWWQPDIERFAVPAGRSGAVMLLNLRMVPGSIMFYAAGIAAVASQRFALLNQLLAGRRLSTTRTQHDTFARCLDAAETYEGVIEPERRHFRFLAPILSEALSLSATAIEDAWQTFEVLRLAAIAATLPRFHGQMDTYEHLNNEINASRASGGDIMAWDRRERVLRDIAQYLPVYAPHVRVLDVRGVEGFRAPTASRLVDAINTQPHHPLISSEFAPSVKELTFALHITSAALGVVGSHKSRQGEILMDLWCDTGESAVD